MEPEYKGKIKFYDDEIDVYFPSNFEKFTKKLGEMLGITENVLTTMTVSYKDDDNDKIEIKVENDYKLFIEEIQKKKKDMVLLVEVKEESSVLIKKCSSSILNYVKQNSSGNINNLTEEIKEKRKSLELSDEINPNDIPKINNEKENKEEKIEKNNDDLNKIYNEIKNNSLGINNNNNNVNNNNIVVNNPNNNQNNNQNNMQNNINNINQIKNNNIINNNNIIDNNNINNINNYGNRNPQQQQPMYQVQNPQQSQQNRQFSNVQNSQNQQSQNINSQNSRYLYFLSFPYNCTLCKKGPIYHVLYFCRDCNLLLCSNCEAREGPRHPHPFSKCQNAFQFEHLNIGNVSNFDKFVDGVGSTVEKGYNSILGWFGGKTDAQNNNNNRSNVQVIRGPQWISMVQVARSNYDLRSFTDKQIEDALIKAKGNMDEAVVILVGQVN